LRFDLGKVDLDPRRCSQPVDDTSIKWNYAFSLIPLELLADRTNGRAYATVLRLSVVCLSMTLCIVAKRCVLEQKLLLRAYSKSYMRN